MKKRPGMVHRKSVKFYLIHSPNWCLIGWRVNLKPDLTDGGNITDPVPEENRSITADGPDLEVQHLRSAPADGDGLQWGVAGNLKSCHDGFT